MTSSRQFAYLALLATSVTACARSSQSPPAVPAPIVRDVPPMHSVIPLPRVVQLDTTAAFSIDSMTFVYIDDNADSATTRVAGYVASMLAPTVKPDLRRVASGSTASGKAIHLRTTAGNAASGPEGYELAITPQLVTINARTAAGLFYGAQTLRQLLPISIEHRAAVGRRLVVPAGRIEDSPRYEWRGMMLDVSRHFLPPADIKRFIDLIAL